MEDQPVHAPPPAPNNPSAPIMDVKAPPSTGGSPATTPGTATAAKQPDKLPAAAQKPAQKASAKGVNAAIFATVIIVLGLAALAVYAYTKTK